MLKPLLQASFYDGCGWIRIPYDPPSMFMRRKIVVDLEIDDMYTSVARQQEAAALQLAWYFSCSASTCCAQLSFIEATCSVTCCSCASRSKSLAFEVSSSAPAAPSFFSLRPRGSALYSLLGAPLRPWPWRCSRRPAASAGSRCEQSSLTSWRPIRMCFQAFSSFFSQVFRGF